MGLNKSGHIVGSREGLPEQSYLRILDATYDMVSILNEDGKFLFANKGWEKVSLCTAEEANERGIFAFVHPEDHEKVREAMRRAFAGQPVRNIQYRVRADDGELRWRETNADLVDWPKTEKALLLVTRDITSRKSMEESLRPPEQQYHSILDTSCDMVMVLDEHARLLYANRAWHEGTYHSWDELTQMDVFDTLHPDDRAACRRWFERVLAGESARGAQYRVISKDRELKWREANADPIHWPGAEKAVLLVLRDITERKRAEEALRQSEERYRTLIESSLTGIYIIRDGKVVFGNDRLSQITGYSMDEALGRPATDFVHPEDRENGRRAVARRLSGEGPDSHYEFRIIARNGDIRWIETYGAVIEYEGRPAIFSNVIDITDRKRAEEAVRVANRFLQIANRHTELSPLLEDFMDEIESLTGCEAVGIRLCDEHGNIPYCAYRGFSEQFYESENHLSIHSDSCMCIDVIKGEFDPELPCSTETGSFCVNGATRFLGSLPDEQRNRTRNVCNQFGYESIALIPIRMGDRILGLIHVADTREDMAPLEIVGLLEAAATQLGPAILRVQTEQAQRESEEKYRNIFQEAPDIFYLLDLETWLITDANKCAFETLDYGPEALGKIHVTEIVHPEDYERAANRLREMVIKKDRMPNFPLRILTRTGEVRHIEQSGVIFWENGRAKTFLGLAHDVTERKKQEEMVRKRNERLAALYEVAKAVNENPDLQAVVDRLLRVIPRVTDSVCMGIFVLDETTETFHYVGHYGLPQDFVEGTNGMRWGKGVLGYATSTGKPLLIPNIHEHPLLSRRSVVAKVEHESVIMTPLIGKDRLFGALVVGKKPGESYTPDDLELVSAIANQVAVAMENASLYSQILQREARLQTILQTSRDGIVVTSEDRRVVYHNPALTSMFGYREDDDLSANDTSTYFAQESYPVLQWIREKLARNEPVEGAVEFKAQRKDGTAFDAELRLGRFFENGRRFEVGVVRDVSERKRMEFQVQQAGKLAALGELATGVAHEMNNPISAIGMQTGLMREIIEEDREKIEPALCERLENYLRMMEGQTRRCQRVTNDLLSFSRTPESTQTTFGINELLKKTVELVLPLTDKEPKLEMTLDEKLPPFRGDRNRLEQVFVNLLSNALKAIRKGGSISVASSLDESGDIRIDFNDSGEGIPPELKGRIFDPFFTTSPEGEGTGLGLSISCYIISQMNGKLEVDSVPGEGTSFSITLRTEKAATEGTDHA